MFISLSMSNFTNNNTSEPSQKLPIRLDVFIFSIFYVLPYFSIHWRTLFVDFVGTINLFSSVWKEITRNNVHNKKTGRPLGLFSELLISHNLQTSYETTLDKTQPFSDNFVLSLKSQVVQSKQIVCIISNQYYPLTTYNV